MPDHPESPDATAHSDTDATADDADPRTAARSAEMAGRSAIAPGTHASTVQLMTSNHLIRLEVSHQRDRQVVEAFARWANVDVDTARAAADSVFAGRATGLLMSGAQGSGKDTVCPAVLDTAGLTTEHCRVAHAIRSEINVALDVMRNANSTLDAARQIAGTLDVSFDTATMYVDRLFDTACDDPDFNAEHRTDAMRVVLQWHGSEGRADKPGYWVKIAYQKILPMLADGISVHLTDGRFPGEIDAGRAVGLYCVRLWVPLEERRRRIFARDGIQPSEASLAHPGEIAADGYWGLDLEIANTAPLDEVTAAIADRFDRFRNQIVDVTALAA